MRAVRIGVPLAGVVLVAAAACVSVGDEPGPSLAGPPSDAAGTSSSPSTATLGDLRIEQPGTWKADPRAWGVTISWVAPPGADIDHYEVSRDGRTVAKDLAQTRYADHGAEPATTYRYTVVGIGADGGRTASATGTVSTGSPPVADARLEGRFGMKMHITSQSGLTSGARGGGLVFIYDPLCRAGACDVRWSRQGASGGGTMTRDGASYAGTASAPFLVHSCRGGTLTETLAFKTRVSKAAVVRGEWRATKIEGTLDESATSSGCVTARISWNFSGFAQA